MFVYEDKAIILTKGFAGTALGKDETTLLFKNTVSVSFDKATLSKKYFICFLQKDGSTVSVTYGSVYEQKAIKLKEFVESRIG